MVQLRVLLTSMDGQGHVNAILGVAGVLSKAGHHIIISLSKGWEKLIKANGYEFVPIVNEGDVDEKDMNNNPDEKTEKKAANEGAFEFFKQLLTSIRKDPITALEEFEDRVCTTYLNWSTEMLKFDEPLKKSIEKINPDIIIIDYLVKLPCLIKGSIPWVSLWSCSPVALYRGRVPPEGTGFPLDSPQELWKKYYDLHFKAYKPVRDNVNKKLIEAGVEPYRDDQWIYLLESPYMNIYNYPECLDYTEVGPKPDKWYRMDAVIREPDDKTPFSLPDNLVEKPGALIYFSLGSMGCVDLELMKRVISVCAKSPHRFIISKGPYHEQIELPDNMWGERYVNQIAILPHVDLVITHGGNNTLTESLYFGKPVIVLPLFYDQLDNAQRIQDKKLGIRLDTYSFTDEQLLDGIEKLLNDMELYDKLERISFEMRNTKTREEIVKLIEKTAITKKSPE
ncbi:uncharacterized UDP-glucosyltransferase YjiC-like [Tetranychus urticae]|uniref:UDP-glycosyltransferase 205A3 n=1 Tax=Tetranychus urticae TaxID=32264 RepID=T1L1Y1_TETUR|nr:uncharacterized UDP-glucosyltransferase YjiC-like [Tetranychus urticae]AHX56912.1 UDP-glycosyltransferase 205A3 [Tetranychus urticae]